MFRKIITHYRRQKAKKECLKNIRKLKELLDDNGPILTPINRGYKSPNKDLYLAVDFGWPEIIDEDSKGGETNENLSIRGEEPENGSCD